MATQDSFKFGCPYCSQHIRAYDEYIGELINCPTCDAEIVVPNPYLLRKAAYVVPTEQSSNYMPAEVQALRAESEELQRNILGIAKEDSWELAVLAEMLSNRLEPLRATISNPNNVSRYVDGLAFTHDDLFRDVDDRFNRFINILYTMYDIMLYSLPQAMYKESLLMIVDFANQIGDQINLVVKFHDHLYTYQLPNEDPYPRIQEVQSAWAPHILRTLDMTVDTLRNASTYTRAETVSLSTQYSIIPPTIHFFLVLRQYLVMLIHQAQEGQQGEPTENP